MWNLIICSPLFTKYHYDDQIKEDETSGTYSTHGGRQDTYEMLVEKLWGRKYNIKIYLRIKSDSVNWIQVAQDRFQWRTVVNMVMNNRFL
jgi:hypothetical protein